MDDTPYRRPLGTRDRHGPSLPDVGTRYRVRAYREVEPANDSAQARLVWARLSPALRGQSAWLGGYTPTKRGHSAGGVEVPAHSRLRRTIVASRAWPTPMADTGAPLSSSIART